MIKAPPKSKQYELEFVCIADFIDENHLLRKIDKHIDFDFIYDLSKDLYCSDNGRPCIDPIILFKALFLGFLYGIRSERQLIEEIKVNIAYRWFLGFSLTDKIFHHSTFSQNRRRRFNGSSVYEEIFSHIVKLGISKKLISGEVLYTDSTHLKANANKNKKIEVEAKENVKYYLDELDKCVKRDRKENGKKDLKTKEKEPKKKLIKQSPIDPESGYMVRDGKPKGFFFLDHRTTDSKYNLIVDVHVTPGNIYDSLPYIPRLDYQIGKFNFNVKSVGLDAGYFTPDICKSLVERDIYGVIGYRRPNGPKGKLAKKLFIYNENENLYVCPENQNLRYRTTNRHGYREYVSNPKICCNCKLLSKCTASKNNQKVITRHIWQKYKEEIKNHRYTEKGKDIYKRRKETVERSFGDAKQLHGYRYARYRGLKKVSMQCLLTAVCQNMKKIANILHKRLEIA